MDESKSIHGQPRIDPGHDSECGKAGWKVSSINLQKPFFLGSVLGILEMNN